MGMSQQPPNPSQPSAGKASRPPSPMQTMAGLVRNYGPQNIAQQPAQQAPQITPVRQFSGNQRQLGRVNNWTAY